MCEVKYRIEYFIKSQFFGFGYALVPFYDQICEATGLRNLLQPDVVANSQVDATRTVRIEFDSNIRKLPWQFRALTPVVDVHPGELRQVMFEIVNSTDRALTGQAIPSYGPPHAAQYFRKLDCFCFSRQTLQPGERRQMPVVFVIENNGYSMGTSQARSSAGELAQRAAGYDMQWCQCGGHDVYEVRAMMDKFLTLARDTHRARTVEIDTYRYRGHSVADPDNTYRSKTEIEEYRRTKDPIQLFQDRLIAEKVIDQAGFDKLDAEARAEADLAADFSEASPFPTPDDIQKDVYWESDHPSERASRGRLFFD